MPSCKGKHSVVDSTDRMTCGKREDRQRCRLPIAVHPSSKSTQQSCRTNLHENFREIFAKFSRVFASFFNFFEVFGLAGTCLDLFGCFRMRSDAPGCVRMHSDAFGKFWKNRSKNQFFRNFRRSRASASPFARAFICREALKSIGGGGGVARTVAWA